MARDLSEIPLLEGFIAQAQEHEQEYNWQQAVECYNKALSLFGDRDLSRKGDVCERTGCAMYQVARQAENSEKFAEAISLAVASYEKAAELYGQLGNAQSPWRLRCDAMRAYLSFWLTPDVTERKRRVDRAWSLAKEALKSFEEFKEGSGYAKTFEQLSTAAILSYDFEPDYQVRERLASEAAERGERAIKFLSNIGSPSELARTYVRAAVHIGTLGYFLEDSEEKMKHVNQALDYFSKAEQLSDEDALTELCLCGCVFGWEFKGDRALGIFEKALEHGRKARDRLATGSSLDWLAAHTFWKAMVDEDPEESLELARKALRFSEEAETQFSLTGYISSRGGTLWTGAPDAEYEWLMARLETEPAERRNHLEKAREVLPRLLKRAEICGNPEILGEAHFVAAKIFSWLAVSETRKVEKKGLLDKVVWHGNQSINILERTTPFDYWNRGTVQIYIAETKSELSNLETNRETQATLLQEAITDKEVSAQLMQQDALIRLSTIYFNQIGKTQLDCGNLSIRLYNISKKRDLLKKGAKAYLDAAATYSRSGTASRMAECYWKAGQAYDTLEEYPKASENFVHASNCFKVAAEKVRQLAALYRDYSTYMQAWGEIEKARYHHGRQDYGSAKKFYEGAADLHKSTTHWSYMAPNYSAWAKAEHAEDLSRRDLAQESIEAFEEAGACFSQCILSLQSEADRIGDPDEMQLVSNLTRAAQLRSEYCAGRVVLEEAKILDVKGDHYSSSEKYAQATERFEGIASKVESEQTRVELQLIIALSSAWHIVTKAEAEAAPQLYLEASRLFEQAKGFSSHEKNKMLVLGHSRFCKALESGARFTDTREVALHAAAVQYLESAASCYLKAGFEKASEYAGATGLLFDAYLYMDQAKRETDQEKRAKLLAVAEKILENSANSYLSAGQPTKKDEVMKLLERVSKEKELAISLTRILRAPSILMGTETFSMPAPTQEKAVGLERFEHADLQVNVTATKKNMMVGENLHLEIELTNSGSAPAQLVKMEELIPASFVMFEKPEFCKMEDSLLNMKGRRLDPLKTEEVKVVLKPTAKGQFIIKPRIFYVDESGRSRSQEPEPLNITVTELGISGWLKGR